MFLFLNQLFSIPFSNQLVLTLAALIFLTSLILLINWKKNLRYTPIFHSEEKNRHHKTQHQDLSIIFYFLKSSSFEKPSTQWSYFITQYLVVSHSDCSTPNRNSEYMIF